MTVYNYLGNKEATANMYIGYYQDESHRGGPGGHYHGLQKRPEIELIHLLSYSRVRYKCLIKNTPKNQALC